MTIGSVEPLKKLYQQWSERVTFVEVVVRQAHPGPRVEAYQSFEEKLQHAEQYLHEEHIPWPVLVDDLAGTVHQLYGGLADPTYVIDSDGRVAFYNMWTHAPTLHTACDHLMQQGGRGVVDDGVDRKPHALAALTNGWKGLRKGLPQSVLDLETAAPTSGVSSWLGYQLRGVLAPLTLRATPLPPLVKFGLTLGAIVAAVKVASLLQDDMYAARRLSSVSPPAH